jgi:hypothetical protein
LTNWSSYQTYDGIGFDVEWESIVRFRGCSHIDRIGVDEGGNNERLLEKRTKPGRIDYDGIPLITTEERDEHREEKKNTAPMGP